MGTVEACCARVCKWVHDYLIRSGNTVERVNTIMADKDIQQMVMEVMQYFFIECFEYVMKKETDEVQVFKDRFVDDILEGIKIMYPRVKL